MPLEHNDFGLKLCCASRNESCEGKTGDTAPLGSFSTVRALACG